MIAYAKRVRMIGGWNSYEVLWRVPENGYRPCRNGTYATIISQDGVAYYWTEDMLRSPLIDNSPIYSDETVEAVDPWPMLDVLAKAIDASILLKAFPELVAVYNLTGRVPRFRNGEYSTTTVEVEWCSTGW